MPYLRKQWSELLLDNFEGFSGNATLEDYLQNQDLLIPILYRVLCRTTTCDQLSQLLVTSKITRTAGGRNLNLSRLTRRSLSQRFSLWKAVLPDH